jgi:hypothetical protein
MRGLGWESVSVFFCRLEKDLEARSQALEASVAGASGSGGGGGGGGGGSGGGGSGSGGNLDLAALLGVEHSEKKLSPSAASAAAGGGVEGSSNGHHQINVQMISILQSQRDQYKEKLTKVRRANSHLFVCVPIHVNF